MRQLLNHHLKGYLFYLGGDQPAVTWIERLRSVFRSCIGLMLVRTIAKYPGELSRLEEWLMASLGASALLIFTLPKSPMAQPWAVIAGNTLSALVSVTAIRLVNEAILAMSLAASHSILGMLILRCLHPPAAVVTLIMVLGLVMHYCYAFFPVMVDSYYEC